MGGCVSSQLLPLETRATSVPTATHQCRRPSRPMKSTLQDMPNVRPAIKSLSLTAGRMSHVSYGLAYSTNTGPSFQRACFQSQPTPCPKNRMRSVSLHHAYRSGDNASMGLCQDCHEETGAMNACHHCHQALPSGHLKTDFGHFRLKPTVTTFPQAVHTEDFDHSHAARMQPELCAECHQDDQCLDCHLSRRQLGIHPPDFLRHHAVDALQDSHRCVQCHTPDNSVPNATYRQVSPNVRENANSVNAVAFANFILRALSANGRIMGCPTPRTCR